MSSKGDREDQSGNLTARSVPELLSDSRAETNDGMKRAAARQLIEKYYYQLTDGCGTTSCENLDCASSPQFKFKEKTKNELALKAIDLFKEKARLCEVQPTKVARAECQPGPSRPTETKTRANDKQSTAKIPISFSQPSTCSVIKPTPTHAADSVTHLTEEKIYELVKICKEEGTWSRLIRVIGSTFNNTDSLIMSFRKNPDSNLPKGQDSQETDADKDKDESQENSKDRFPIQESSGAEGTYDESEVSVDVESLRRVYKTLIEIPDVPFQGALINALNSLSRSVEMDLRHHKPLDRNPHYINVFVIVMEIPWLDFPEFIECAYPEFCKALGHLAVQGQAKLAKVWSKFGAERIHEMVQSLHQMITVKIAQSEDKWGRGYYINDDNGISGATKVMKILYYASILEGERDSDDILTEEKSVNETEESLQNMLQLQGAVGHEPKETQRPKEDPLAQELSVTAVDCRKPLVPYDEFVNELLNEYVDIETDYKYKLENDTKFSFMNHSFILTTASKHTCMYFDNRVRMFNERRTSILQTFMHGMLPIPFLRLRVRRDHLIDDALVALEMTAMDNPQDLKKQLFVEFEGEQGLDEGGVSKEFFQLVVDEIFNPDFGMFTFNDETQQFWFNPTSFENDGQFTLIGIILGLAIYNSTIVDVHFPSVVYRKLMGKKGTYQDMIDFDPTMAKSFQELLEYRGDDMEEVMMQPFRIGYKDVFGCDLTHDLKEKGEQIFVNQENKEEFVDLYSNFLLNKSIEKQFRAFKRGFQMVMNQSPLRALFRPEEVELLICGSKHFDFYELEKATEYDGGFNAESPAVKHFWEIVHEFSDEQKRKLLQFTTGTDRVPVGGLSKIKLIIARNGPDTDRLPTAHTCFNVLLLPDYTSKEKMKERLTKAINYSKGFGML